MLEVTDGINIDFDNVTITVINSLPIADAGVNQGTLKGIYSLDGSGSVDTDGSIVNYTWTFTYDGGAKTLYGVNPSYDFQNQADHQITLTVTDNDAGVDTDTCWVNITWLYPVADAGTDQTGLKGTYFFDGSGSSDGDGTIQNLTWNFTYSGSPVVLYTAFPMYNFQIIGNYLITLNVTDDDALTDEDTMWMNVTNANPVAHAGTDIVGKRLLSFDGSVSSDVDGSIVNYTWTFSDDGTPVTIWGVSPSYDFNISQAQQ